MAKDRHQTSLSCVGCASLSSPLSRSSVTSMRNSSRARKITSFEPADSDIFDSLCSHTRVSNWRLFLLAALLLSCICAAASCSWPTQLQIAYPTVCLPHHLSSLLPLTITVSSLAPTHFHHHHNHHGSDRTTLPFSVTNAACSS